MDLNKVLAMQYSVENKCTSLFLCDGSCVKVLKKPQEILECWCLLQGSSVQGRVDSFKYVVKAKQKIPVLISLCGELIFFPLSGVNVEESVWLQYRYIQKVTSTNTSSCVVHFVGNYQMKLMVGPRVVYRQIRRCKYFLESLKCHVFSGEILLDDVCYNVSGDINE